MSDAVLKYGEPENYVNRELSWLEFNYRILGEARDKTTPLFERLKFLSITRRTWMSFSWSAWHPSRTWFTPIIRSGILRV
ncbi:hypothetical protein [Clostridium sp. AF50-3]|uniref:hypothetical protein n=1 Tax=Clostridium sp. AF50-3 TaxID=2293021 RepID=UPI001FA95412|nr:hypothetical protein [Clostridium sp. AF50-3]